MQERRPRNHNLNATKSFFINSLALDLDLSLTLLVTFATLIFVFLPPLNGTVIRSVLGTVFIFITPGYALVSALFPQKQILKSIERFALSVGLSAVIVVLLGQALNYSRWGIRLEPVLLCVVIMVAVFTAIAGRRRRSVSHERWVSIDVDRVFPKIHSFVAPAARKDKVLNAVLLVSVIVALSTLGFVVTATPPGERYTEFYILGKTSNALSYPTEFKLGETKPVTVGVVNHENQQQMYDLQVVLRSNDTAQTSVLYSDVITVQHGAKWEKVVNLTPDRVGKNMEIDFLLYRHTDLSTPYRETRFGVDVTTPT